MKEIEAREISQYDGKSGNPAYIVHKGKVFDVTESKLWKNGLHMQRHHAGENLTTAIEAAPHGTEVLERYPQVAVLKSEAAPEQRTPQVLAQLLARFPVLRRHPHPMTVHFPIVFMFVAPLFTLLYLVSGIASFELTAVNCLGAGLIFTPVAIATGFYTWWLNYGARSMRPVRIKQRLSLLLFAAAVVAFIWRMAVPDIVHPLRFAGVLYLALLCSLFALVAAIGWFGATLTFPVDRE